MNAQVTELLGDSPECISHMACRTDVVAVQNLACWYVSLPFYLILYLHVAVSNHDGCVLNIQSFCIAEMVQLREAGKDHTASSAQLPQVCIS